MNSLKMKSWSPYVVGALIGVLSWFAFATADKPLGITTAFEYTAALIEKGVAPQAAANNSYFSEPEKTPKIDWEWMLVVGVFLGAFVSSKLSGDRTTQTVPPLWRWRFGDGAAKRLVGRLLRRRADDVRGAPRARVHERSRHQRRAATRRLKLDVRRTALCERRGDGVLNLRKGGREPCSIR